MMATSRRQAFWAPHVAALRSSNQTATAYAKDHGLSVHALGWWHRKLKRSATTEAGTSSGAPRSAFVALKVSQPMMTQATGVTITIGGEVRMQMSELPPPTWVVALSQAMRGAH